MVKIFLEIQNIKPNNQQAYDNATNIVEEVQLQRKHKNRARAC
jgi:hypothetical protein